LDANIDTASRCHCAAVVLGASRCGTASCCNLGRRSLVQQRNCSAYFTGTDDTQDVKDGMHTLSGKVTNHSWQTLRYLEFEVTLKDCRPVGYGPDECDVVGQKRIAPRVEIPANQARIINDVASLYNLHNLPHRDPQRPRFFSWRFVRAICRGARPPDRRRQRRILKGREIRHKPGVEAIRLRHHEAPRTANDHRYGLKRSQLLVGQPQEEAPFRHGKIRKHGLAA
jgi:hypothetical protein